MPFQPAVSTAWGHDARTSSSARSASAGVRLQESLFQGTRPPRAQSSKHRTRCKCTQLMPIRRRQIRIAQVVVLLLALANAALAQGGAWRCDTGQLCRGHATGHCCCPPERQPATCDSAAPAACCGKAGLRKDQGPSCCRSQSPDPHRAARRVPSTLSLDTRLAGSCSGHGLAAAPHCRCLFSVSASPEVSLEPTLLLTSSIVAPVPERPTAPLPSTRTFAAVTPDADPPPSLICLPPQGSRAPPAS